MFGKFEDTLTNLNKSKLRNILRKYVEKFKTLYLLNPTHMVAKTNMTVRFTPIVASKYLALK